MKTETTLEPPTIPPLLPATGSALERIRALQAKAAMKQAAVDACQGHIWRADYVSQIVASPPAGGSSVCVRCGERRAWKDIGPDEQTEFQSSPNNGNQRTAGPLTNPQPEGESGRSLQ